MGRGVAHGARIGFLLIALLLVAWARGYGQIARHANAFLELGISAIEESLGRTSLGAQYELGRGKSNPASLNSLRHPYTAGGSFLSQLGNLGQLGYLAFGMQLEAGSGMEVSLTRFGVDDIPNTLDWKDQKGEADFGRIRYFSIADYALHVSYGRNVWVEGLSIGGTAKAVYRHEGHFAKGIGIGINIGFRYEYRGWEFGTVLRDATSTWTLWFVDEQSLQSTMGVGVGNRSASRAAEGTLPSVDIGGGYAWNRGGKWSGGLNMALRLGFDGGDGSVLSTERLNARPALGTWVAFDDMVYLQLGARQFQLIKEFVGHKTLSLSPSAGLGVKGWGFRLDYALGMPLTGITVQPSHMFTLSYSWDKRSKDTQK